MSLTDFFHSAYFTLNPEVALTTRAHGIDNSKYDLFFRPETATGQLDFVIQRISYRTTRDEAFDTLLPGVLKVPIRGGYHYLNSDTAWRTQADRFISFVAGIDYHFFVCDFEGAFNVMGTDFAFQAWQWIQYVQDKTGKPVLLYTSPSLYSSYIYPSQARFGINWNEIDYWQAQYFFVPNPDGTPVMPTGRTAGWTLWQYTSKADGTKYGLARSTAGDLDVFNGTVAQMREKFKVGGSIPPEPEEGMFYGRNKTVLTNIRTGPAGNYADIGDLLLGDLIEADRKQKDLNGVDWWHLTKITRNGANVPLPAVDGWCWGTNIETLPAPQPTGNPARIDMTLAGGSVVTIKDTNGNTLWTGTA